MGTYNKQHLKDTNTETVVKFVGNIDATGPALDGANNTLVVSYLKGSKDTGGALRSSNTGGTVLPFYGVKIQAVEWSTNTTVQLVWRGSSANATALALSGTGRIDFAKSGAVIPWNATGTGANTGELFVDAPGVATGNYTIVVTVRKDPEHFDKGALTDRAYFSNP
jgi:hypothetical protein